MLDHVAIRQGFRELLLDVSERPNEDRLAWENRPFAPPDITANSTDDCLWIKESYLPGAEVLAATNQIEGVGIVQYDVVVPMGRGTERAEVLAKLIAEQYKPSTSLASPGYGQTVTIVRCTRSPGRDFAATRNAYGLWWGHQVVVEFRAYCENRANY